MIPNETDPVEFDWHSLSWNIRPSETLRPHNGEYLIQSHGSFTSIPMNLPCLCLHLGCAEPKQPFPIRTIATFLELTAKVTHLTLPHLLHEANSLRIKQH
jgi:hypothetical protein